jgi:hypothetical protein
VERGELGQGGRGLQRGGRLTALLDQVLAAHGGREAWESTAEVLARLHTGGFALKLKRVREPFPDYRATISMHEPRTVIEPYPGAGRAQAGRGVFEADHVRIEDDTGATVDGRADMRRRFPGLRRRLWWDHLDALYFSGYALWNYFTTPLLLTRCEVEERGRTMLVTFPADIPTHSRRQRFHFDENGLLTRLDYTAEVFGKWARGRHECRNHRTFDGLVFPTSRRVTLGALARPTIIWIEVDDVACLRQ